MAADCGVFFGEVEGGSGGVEGEEVEAGLVEGADEEVHCFSCSVFFFFCFFPFGERVGGGGGVGLKGFQVVLLWFLSVKMGWFVVRRVLRWSSFLCFI